jgi:hypothetical protein
VGGNREYKKVTIITPPEVGKYDVLIFGSNTVDFDLVPTMKTYLEEIPSLQNKKIKK